MKQYLDLLKTIKVKGTYKPAARENMPGTQSLFGYQFRHSLSDGFPLLTTKKMPFKSIVVELLWFLRGDTNIKYLVDNGCHFWDEDAYNYYLKQCKLYQWLQPMSFETFVAQIKVDDVSMYDSKGNKLTYTLGDCGFQYGRVWRNWQSTDWEQECGLGVVQGVSFAVDQIRALIEGLKSNPESRRHIVTAIDPAHDQDLALYWCHAMFQFNCRPLTQEEKVQWVLVNTNVEVENLYIYEETLKPSTPKYYLDCQLYQRSADSVLGVPCNIASYALLTHIIAELCNMIPGEFIHSFGDVHIYDNHEDAVEELLTRTPSELPKLVYSEEFYDLCEELENGPVLDLSTFLQELKPSMFKAEGYDPYPAIKAELSTGLKK